MCIVEVMGVCFELEFEIKPFFFMLKQYTVVLDVFYIGCVMAVDVF